MDCNEPGACIGAICSVFWGKGTGFSKTRTAAIVLRPPPPSDVVNSGRCGQSRLLSCCERWFSMQTVKEFLFS